MGIFKKKKDVVKEEKIVNIENQQLVIPAKAIERLVLCIGAKNFGDVSFGIDSYEYKIIRENENYNSNMIKDFMANARIISRTNNSYEYDIDYRFRFESIDDKDCILSVKAHIDFTSNNLGFRHSEIINILASYVIESINTNRLLWFAKDTKFENMMEIFNNRELNDIPIIYTMESRNRGLVLYETYNYDNNLRSIPSLKIF